MDDEKTVLYTCQYEMTPEIFREGYARILRTLRVFYIIFLVIGAICIVETVLFRLLGESDMFVTGVCGLCLLLLGIIGLIRGKRNTDTQYRSLTKLGGTALYYEVREDGIFSRSSTGEGLFPASAYLRLIETKNLFLVYIGEDRAAKVIFLPKDGFPDIGQAASFLAYFTGKVGAKNVKLLKK